MLGSISFFYEYFNSIFSLKEYLLLIFLNLLLDKYMIKSLKKRCSGGLVSIEWAYDFNDK